MLQVHRVLSRALHHYSHLIQEPEQLMILASLVWGCFAGSESCLVKQPHLPPGPADPATTPCQHLLSCKDLFQGLGLLFSSYLENNSLLKLEYKKLIK